MRLAFLLIAVFFQQAVAAQGFPERPITIVVPYPPGSSSDLIPRAMAPHVSQSMGVPVLVENRPGAGGNVGSAIVAKGDASGHTVLLATSGILATNQWLYKQLGYDPQKDFTPVTNAATTPNMWVAHPDVPAKTIAEVIALAKSKPGALTFASGGNGTSSHLCGELLKTTAKIEMLHVPYKGPAPALQDVLAGRVPLMCDNFSNVAPHVRSGRLKAIALTAMKRHAQAPEVPTANETGLPGFEVGNWYGFAVPSGTPRPALDRLHAALVKALGHPQVKERLEQLGLTIVADTPEQFARFVAVESEKMRKLVQASGARVD